MRWWLILVSTLGACSPTIPKSSLPDWHAAAAHGCQVLPLARGPAKFRHRTNRAAHRLGEPRHRGYDLVTSVAATSQTFEADLGYMAVDKAIEDEDVEIFACEHDAWISLGATRSDSAGHAVVTVTGDQRLPAGMHEIYLAVAGDGRGVGFVAYVAPAGATTFVTDVDGTLTSTENDIVKAVLFKSDLDDQPGAPAALRTLANDMQVIYLTARPHAYIELTRRWLTMHGYPRGPILTSAHFARPGTGALDHKRHLLAFLSALGITPAIAIGNRASDVLAYEHIAHVFVKIPGYTEELAPLVARGAAVEFSSYADLPDLVTHALQ